MWLSCSITSTLPAVKRIGEVLAFEDFGSGRDGDSSETRVTEYAMSASPPPPSS